MWPCYVGNVQNVICLMILECGQIIFKTLSAPLWFVPFLGQCCLPVHTTQILQGASRPPPAAGGWTSCVGKQLVCHLLPRPLPHRQHPEQLCGADAAVPLTGQQLLFEHCPIDWNFECLVNGTSTD